MSLLVSGEVDRVSEQTRTFPDGETFVQRTVVIKDWGATLYVDLGRNYPEGDMPVSGEKVALEVATRGFQRKDQSFGVGLTAMRRARDTEAALFGSRSASVKAV